MRLWKFWAPFLLLLALALASWLLLRPTDLAPTLQGQTLTGTAFNTSAWRGRPVLVNFWATSCPTCVAEMPELVRLHQKYHGQGLEVLAVAMSYDAPAYVDHFRQERQLPFHVALDLNEKMAQAYGGIVGTPTTFLINPDGRIHSRIVGRWDPAKLEAWIQQALPPARAAATTPLSGARS